MSVLDPVPTLHAMSVVWERNGRMENGKVETYWIVEKATPGKWVPLRKFASFKDAVDFARNAAMAGDVTTRLVKFNVR